MIRKIHLLTILLLALNFVTPSWSQDDFSVKGIDDVAKPAAQSRSTASADGETGEKSLFTLVKEGGWAIYPLGLMLLAILALSIYLFIDTSNKNFAPPTLVAQLNQAMESGDLEKGMQAAAASSSCLGQVMSGSLEC